MLLFTDGWRTLHGKDVRALEVRNGGHDGNGRTKDQQDTQSDSGEEPIIDVRIIQIPQHPG